MPLSPRSTKIIAQKIGKYDIVTSNCMVDYNNHKGEKFDGLIHLVNVKISQGWFPIGGITLLLPGFSQVIVKYG